MIADNHIKQTSTHWPKRVKRLFVSCAVVSVGLVAGTQANAVMLLGPDPYLSGDDSPFAEIAFDYFHLEDFEDRALNTPGVAVSPGGDQLDFSASDSVDGDDGAIDGSGSGGFSLFSGFVTDSFTFTFNAGALGALPTHAGVVWTDVNTPPVDEVVFEVFGSGGDLLGIIGPETVGDGDFRGATAEDRFFGAIEPSGISAITMRMVTSSNWELDHLQYGATIAVSPPGNGTIDVPEPGTVGLIGVGVLGLALSRRRHRVASAA